MKKLLCKLLLAGLLLFCTAVPAMAAGTVDSFAVRVPAGSVPARSALDSLVGSLTGSQLGTNLGAVTGAAALPGKLLQPIRSARRSFPLGALAGSHTGGILHPLGRAGRLVGGASGALTGVPRGQLLLPGDKLGGILGQQAGLARGVLEGRTDTAARLLGSTSGALKGALRGSVTALPKLLPAQTAGTAVGVPLGALAGQKNGLAFGPLKWISSIKRAALAAPQGTVLGTVLLPGGRIGRHLGEGSGLVLGTLQRLVPASAGLSLSSTAGSTLGRNIGALTGLVGLPMNWILQGAWQLPAIANGILGAETGALMGLALGLPSAPLGYTVGGHVGRITGALVGPPLGALGGALDGGAIGLGVGYVTGFLLGMPTFTSLILAPAGAVIGAAIWAAVCAPIWYVVGAFNGAAVCQVLGHVAGAVFGLAVEAAIGAVCGYIFGRFLGTLPILLPAAFSALAGSAMDTLTGALLGELLGTLLGTAGGLLFAALTIGSKALSLAGLFGLVGNLFGVFADAFLGTSAGVLAGSLIGVLLGTAADGLLGALFGALLGGALGRIFTVLLVMTPHLLMRVIPAGLFGGAAASCLSSAVRGLHHALRASVFGALTGSLADGLIGSVLHGISSGFLGHLFGKLLDRLLGAQLFGTAASLRGAQRGFGRGLFGDFLTGALLGRSTFRALGGLGGALFGALAARAHQKTAGAAPEEPVLVERARPEQPVPVPPQPTPAVSNVPAADEMLQPAAKAAGGRALADTGEDPAGLAAAAVLAVFSLLGMGWRRKTA